MNRNKDWNSKLLNKWHSAVSSFRQQLKYNKYDGVGEGQNLTGVAIFNPSFVEPLEISLYWDGYKSLYGEFVKFDKKYLIKDIETWLDFVKEKSSEAEYEEFQKLLDEYSS